MSQQIQVGTNPNAVLFGQQPACTVVNTGLVTVYLGNDATVTAGVDFPLQPGASMHYADGVPVWAVTDSTAPVAGQVQAILDADQAYIPGGSGARVLYDGSMASNPTVGTVPYRAAPSMVGGSITVIVYAKTTTALSGLDNSFVTIRVGDQIPTLPTDAVPSNVNQQWLADTVHSASFRINTAGTSTGNIVVGQPLFTVTFPWTTGSGFMWAVKSTGAYSANSFGIRVLVNQYAVASIVVNAQSMYASASYVLSANGTAAGVWNQNDGSSLYTGNMTQAASTTTLYWLPTLSGPVRIRASATQTGAGSCTMTLVEALVTTSTSQYDTALVSSSAAGSLFGAATYGVWPASPMALQVVTAAGVSLSAFQITISSGAQ